MCGADVVMWMMWWGGDVVGDVEGGGINTHASNPDNTHALTHAPTHARPTLPINPDPNPTPPNRGVFRLHDTAASPIKAKLNADLESEVGTLFGLRAEKCPTTLGGHKNVSKKAGGG